MINGNNQYWQNAAMNIRKDGDEWRLAKDTVSNTYTPEDEGKVVSDGELVAQTAMPDEVTDNGTIDTTLYDSVTVNVSGGGAGASDVTFYDYDGTVVDSYTTAEFAELSDLPANPTHDGLTAQGWNWTLADAKTYVAANGKLNIGQMYANNTMGGKTYLHIRLGEARLKPYLGLTGNSSGTAVDIDWGDNSTPESATLNDSTVYTPHEYASDGEYIISISVTSGSISLNGINNSANLFRKSASIDVNNDKVYANILIKAELGTGVTYIGDYAFCNCNSLTSVTISSSATSIGYRGFYICPSLKSVTMPTSVTSIGNSAFYGCYSLISITIPTSVTSIENSTFHFCYSLTSIAIPMSVTSIGTEAFRNCNSLTLITLPSLMTIIKGSTFYGCSSLATIIIPSGVTTIGSNAFYTCYALSSVTIPSTVTSIESAAFNSCNSLAAITIPSGVTKIEEYAFQSCTSLTSITIPSLVTSIGSSAFYDARGLGFIKFNSATPPTVSSGMAWSYIPTDCIIYVPTGTLSDYTSAKNYPNPSNYQYVEY